MALSSDMSAADIAAVTGNANNGWGFGSDGTWLLILFLFAFMGNGWGGNGFGGGNDVLPYAYAQNTDNLITSGFNQAATTAALGDISLAISSGFAGKRRRIDNAISISQKILGLLKILHERYIITISSTDPLDDSRWDEITHKSNSDIVEEISILFEKMYRNEG